MEALQTQAPLSAAEVELLQLTTPDQGAEGPKPRADVEQQEAKCAASSSGFSNSVKAHTLMSSPRALPPSSLFHRRARRHQERRIAGTDSGASKADIEQAVDTARARRTITFKRAEASQPQPAAEDDEVRATPTPHQQHLRKQTLRG